MNNNSQQILLTINLEKGTILRGSKNTNKPVSKITKSTVLSAEFIAHAKKDDSFYDAKVRKHDWKRMKGGERINAMIKTIVSDELRVPTEHLINNIHFNWTLLK